MPPLCRAWLFLRSPATRLFGGDGRWGSDGIRLHPALVWSPLVAIDEGALKNKSMSKKSEVNRTIWLHGTSSFVICAANDPNRNIFSRTFQPVVCQAIVVETHTTRPRSNGASARQQEHHTASLGEKEGVCICVIVCTRACVSVCLGHVTCAYE